MWQRITLQTRILIIVAALTVVTIGGGLISFWYSHQTNSFIQLVVDENLSALQAADGLETALVMQKGYLTYFFQDGDPNWLDELAHRHEDFEAWLNKAGQWADTPELVAMLDEVGRLYGQLRTLREQVIQLYKTDRRTEGYAVHQQARRLFFRIHDLTRMFRHDHEERINQAKAAVRLRTGLVNRLALFAVPLALFLSAWLTFMLVSQVLGPIRRLAQEASPRQGYRNPVDEVTALKRGVHSLLEDVDHTKSALEASRVHLIQASKMASVGKLAASVAHSIRNPLTAVKMRLFSLERNLILSDTQRDDFNVISEEIRHIDNIVRNFLEFSRRPKLSVQRISASEVVDMALNLVRPRLESYWVKLELLRPEHLPLVEADVDQLKEALVNLLFNASEAVEENGLIVVEEEVIPDPIIGRAAVIRIRDNGPGVPESLQGQIFQPFFSTKDEGTGLGLSIAMRIIEEHGGLLEFESPPEGGAMFVISLPVREGWPWKKS